MKKLLGMLIMIAALTVMCVSASADNYKPIPGSKEAALNDQGFNVVAFNEKDYGMRLVIFLDGDSDNMQVVKRWVRLEKAGSTISKPKVVDLNGGWNIATMSNNDNKQVIELEMYYVKMPDSYVEKKVVNYTKNVPVNLDDVAVPTAHERRVR